MILFALKVLGIAWTLVVLGFCAHIGREVLLSALAERRGRRVHRGRHDVAYVDEIAARWGKQIKP